MISYPAPFGIGQMTNYGQDKSTTRRSAHVRLEVLQWPRLAGGPSSVLSSGVPVEEDVPRDEVALTWMPDGESLT